VEEGLGGSGREKAVLGLLRFPSAGAGILISSVPFIDAGENHGVCLCIWVASRKLGDKPLSSSGVTVPCTNSTPATGSSTTTASLSVYLPANFLPILPTEEIGDSHNILTEPRLKFCPIVR